MFWMIVGSPIGRLVGVVLAVILTSFLLIQFGQNIQEQRQIKEELQGNVETRERIDAELETAPTDPSDALDWLRDRQN